MRATVDLGPRHPLRRDAPLDARSNPAPAPGSTPPPRARRCLPRPRALVRVSVAVAVPTAAAAAGDPPRTSASRNPASNASPAPTASRTCAWWTGTAGWSMRIRPSETTDPAAPRLTTTMRGPAAWAAAMPSVRSPRPKIMPSLALVAEQDVALGEDVGDVRQPRCRRVDRAGTAGRSRSGRPRPVRAAKAAARPRCHMSGKWSSPPEWTRSGAGSAVPDERRVGRPRLEARQAEGHGSLVARRRASRRWRSRSRRRLAYQVAALDALLGDASGRMCCPKASSPTCRAASTRAPSRREDLHRVADRACHHELDLGGADPRVAGPRGRAALDRG